MSKTFMDKDLDAEMAEMEEDGSEEEEDMDEKDDGNYSATFVSYCNTT